LRGKILLLDAVHGCSQVVDEYRSLRRDGGSGLGVWKGGSVTKGEDV